MLVEGKKEQGSPEEFEKWHERITKYKEWVQSQQLVSQSRRIN
jgi:hypothetical protein